MAKLLGSVASVNFFISAPIPMNFTHIELNMINILVGMNGVGKSFIMAATYMMNMIMSAKILSTVHSVSFDIIKEAQFIAEGCIDTSVTGKMGIHYENSATLDIAFKDGKVLNVNTNGIDDVEEPTNMVYMSASMRTFQAMCIYLIARKATGFTNTAEIIKAMSKGYKLYDIMYMERIISKMPIPVDAAMKQRMEKFDIKEDIIEFSVDLDKCIFIANTTDNGPLTIHQWFGSGHQALLNMMLGSFL